MFDVDTIVNKSEFMYWFVRMSKTTWNVVTNDEDQNIVAVITESETDIDIVPTEVESSDYSYLFIKDDFTMFQRTRPEYVLGKHINSSLLASPVISEKIKSELQNTYDTLIAGVYFCAYSNDEEMAKKLTKRCIKWLSSTDFYIAPASTIHHDSEPCGLIRHTLKVVDKMIELLSLSTFEKVNYYEAILTALVHDWCKIDFYEQYMRNVKDDTTGVWNKIPAYRYKGSSFPFGHGVTSLFIAQKFFKLTTEQALTIRWHMGEYNLAENERYDLMDANEKYPMVLLLQFADRLSIIQNTQ